MNALLIGVDGGATEVKAHAVDCTGDGPGAFHLRPEAAARIYARLTDFHPLAVADQLAQRDAAAIPLSPAEIEQGRAWVAAAAEAIAAVAQSCGATRVLVGMGMPGLKTPDGRGINVINNGPRMPDFLQQLEGMLSRADVTLAAPIAALGSDADYCGIGEEFAADGLFRDVANAYYLGGGTGIADALKLGGHLVPFDQAKTWLQKTWQMTSSFGPTYEKLVSAAALNRVWTAILSEPERRSEPERQRGAPGASDEATERRSDVGRDDRSEPERERGVPAYPERAALEGNAAARALLHTAALVLAELIFERIWTVKNGRAEAPHRGEAYARLAVEHEYRGTLLDRVVIGQRIGLIYAQPEYRVLFGAPLEDCLAALIRSSSDAALVGWYLAGAEEQLNPGFLCASRLRAAPALGAAVAAAHAARHS